MNDPKLILPQTQRIPDEWRRKYLQRTPEQLAQDVSKAFDENWKLRKDAIHMNERLLNAQHRARIAHLKIWILSAAVLAQWAVILKLFR